MRSVIALFVATLSVAAIAVAGESPVPGAKDLFYDPSEGTTVSVQVKVQAPAPEKRTDNTSRKALEPPSLRPIAPPSGIYGGTGSKNRGLHYRIELEEPGSKGSYVTAHNVFHSGQRIRLHFVSNVAGRILLIQLGASGTSTVLFPDSGKGLTDNQMNPREERVLPSEEHWFRFDSSPGTERLIALFARDEGELARFPVKPEMGPAETKELMQNVSHVQGSKDLVIETETQTVAQVGTYGVNLKGESVILEIALQHQ